MRPRGSDPAVGVVPVTGISNRLLTRAIRRGEARWRELYGPQTDVADIPRILAASALAADRGDASFIDTLTPRPSLRLSLHLVDLLEDELLEEPEARPFSVTKLLSEVQDVVRTLAAQKGLEVTFIRPNVDRRIGHPIELHRTL